MELSKKREDVETALSVLRKAKEFDRYATVAGGFPRDLYFNKQYKDVDVYVRAIDSFNTADYQHFVKFLYPNLEDFDTTGSMDHWEESGISWIDYTCRFFINDLEINLIFVKGMNPIGVCDTFDFDICQFYLDSVTGEPRKAAYSDFSDKKVKMASHVRGIQREYSITGHYPKLKAKYPEFDFGETEDEYFKLTTKLGALL